MFSFRRNYFEINSFDFFLYVLVPVNNENEENTNTFLSSSLQKSPSTDSSSREEIPVKEKANESKEIINQTVSTIVLEQERNEIEQNEESTPDLSEEQKETTPVTPSSGLNPEATPFFVRSSSQIENIHSISTGNESDDENDSNETPITSGKCSLKLILKFGTFFVLFRRFF